MVIGMKRLKIALSVLVLLTLVMSGCQSAVSPSAQLMPATEPVRTFAPVEGAPAQPQTNATQAPAPSDEAVQTQAPAVSEVRLYLSGNKLPLETPCQIIDGFVMVPVAEVVDAFNREIDYTADATTLTINDPDKGNVIVIQASSATAQINGSAANMEAPAVMTDGGVMLIELSAFRLLFDADNKFVEEHASAYIVESGLC